VLSDAIRDQEFWVLFFVFVGLCLLWLSTSCLLLCVYSCWSLSVVKAGQRKGMSQVHGCLFIRTAQALPSTSLCMILLSISGPCLPSSAGEVQEENCPDGFRAVMDYLRSSTLLLSIRLGFPRQGKGNDWILVGKLTSVTTLGFQPTLEPAGTGLLTGWSS
jgi:hypothetical protein